MQPSQEVVSFRGLNNCYGCCLPPKGLCFLRCFSHNLVANLGKSCSSKPSQHDCNSSIFTAQPQLFGFHETLSCLAASPDRNAPSIHIPAKTKSIHVALICNLSATPVLNLRHLFSGKGQSYYCR